jgi:uncharacterized protein YkwD
MSSPEQTSDRQTKRWHLGLLVAGLAAVAGFGTGASDAAAASCTKADASPTQMSRAAIARTTLCLVNAERHSQDLRPLRMSHALSAAALRHSSDMVRRSYFSHTAPGGQTFLQRIRDSGYLRSAERWRAGENLGWGAGGAQSSPRAIVQAWMQSPPHRKAILTPAYRQAGVGVVRGVPTSHSTPGATYTIDFGFKR